MKDILKRLQETQIEILKVIDRFCTEKDIQYSLYAGTLLGAVRHKGFIPWDDDLDICMSRENYNKFIELWEKEAPRGYVIQNKDNSPRFTQSFTKIRKDHTTFLQDEAEVGAYHTGIFVDVFPVDRLPNGKINRLLFYWSGMKYQLFTREFVPPKANWIVKIVSYFMLITTTPTKRVEKRKKLLKKLTAYDNDSSLIAVTTETLGAMKQHHRPDMLDNYIRLPFEDDEFMCFADWDNHLCVKYHDYMQLPPESERVWKHHPLIIDFEHNYEELN